MALTCQPPWWAYLIMVPCVFSLCLLLNYVLNRINAARIEERYAQFIAKDSNNQGIQAQQETMMRMETPKRAMSSPTCLQTHPIEVTRVCPEEQLNVASEPVAETVVKKPSDVVSTSKVVNIASNPIFLSKVYNVQLENSSKSIEKQNVIPKQEPQDTGNELSEIKKKAKDCESMPAFRRMMDDHNSRDCVSDTAITICNKETKEDTDL
ncbi:uncharacterized protein [Choristoneura fumiferana]|uniref:uncharacterized protein n=1 Tax=Choristoneura fumiferana TaxID=7141 RepID=UPI003D154D10